MAERCECTNYKPCICTPQPGCVIDPCKDCIKVSSPVILPRSSVGCTNSGVVNLKPLNNYTICGVNGEVFHKVVRYDESIFSSAYIDDSNDKLELKFTLTDKAIPWNFYPIYYKAACIDNGKGSFGVVQIGVKDLCEYSGCNNCDPCTGDCVEGTVDLSVTIGDPENIKVTLT